MESETGRNREDAIWGGWTLTTMHEVGVALHTVYMGKNAENFFRARV